MGIEHLKQLIRETLYRARTPDGRETQVDAGSTMEAGQQAADHFGGGIDPFTIDLQPVQPSYGLEGPSRDDLDPRKIVVYKTYGSGKDAHLFKPIISKQGKVLGQKEFRLKRDWAWVVDSGDVADWFQELGIEWVRIADLVSGKERFVEAFEFIDDLVESGMPEDPTI